MTLWRRTAVPAAGTLCALIVCGAAIVFEGRRRAGVQIAIEFLDPDGHNLEIYWGLDQIVADGVARPASARRGAKSLEEAVANPPPGQVPVVRDKGLIEGAQL